MEKKKHGITIYQPEGAAAEYAKWACNLYNGCTNRCDYCYNRHSQRKNLLGKDDITPKKMWTDDDLYHKFQDELDKWRGYIIEDGGLHFNFVSDPCLPDTWRLNLRCIRYAMLNFVPVRILTKMHNWMEYPDWRALFQVGFFRERRGYIKFGFTLTGMDELEPGASTNAQRIDTMRQLHKEGYQTWASIEPVIDIRKSTDMILQTLDCCDEYRIGLNSLKKAYTPADVRKFKEQIDGVMLTDNVPRVVIWKDSVLKFIESMITNQSM